MVLKTLRLIFYDRGLICPYRCVRTGFSLIVMLHLLMLSAASVADTDIDGPIREIVRHVGSEQISWDEAQLFVVGGVAVQAVPFESPLAAVDVAELMSASSSVFEQVLNTSDQIVLSGLQHGWHWVALITGVQSGSAGYVSAMQTKVRIPVGMQVWLPSDSRITFSHREDVDGRVIDHQVYQHPWPSLKLTTHIDEKLSRHGWKREFRKADLNDRSQWHRGNEQLIVMTIPAQHGSSVFLQYKGNGSNQ